MRIEHPESVRFNQVVVFGRRKKSHQRGEPKGADELLRIAYKPHLLPVLNQELVERYAVPPSGPRLSLTRDYRWMWLRIRFNALWQCRMPAAFLYANNRG